MKEDKGQSKKHLLIVSTVSLTLKSFFVPYAEFFKGQGWVVDGAANGVIGDGDELATFNNLYEIPWQRRIFSIKNLVSIKIIRSIIVGNHYSLVHVHTPISAMLLRIAMVLVPKKHRPKIVYTAHGFHFSHRGRGMQESIFRFIEKIAVRYTDGLLVINEEDHFSGSRLTKGTHCKLYKVPGVGLNIGEYARRNGFNELKAKLGISESAKTIVVIGELNPGKRVQDIIRAVSSLNATISIKLIVAGEGPLYPELVELVRELELEEKVMFVGYRKDIPAILGAADLLVHASVREGLPRVIMEAMAAKIPIVATDVRGNRDLLKDGAGTLVPVKDPNALSKAIMDNLQYDCETKAKVDLAYQRIQYYDVNNVLEIQKKIYDEIII